MAQILVLEDDQNFAAILVTSLEAAGHDVTHFTVASDALEAFRQNPADLVVADLIIRQDGLPVSDGGLLLIHRIKEMALSQRKSVPVIAISGVLQHRGMMHALNTAQHVGADEILAKPFAPDDLLFVINRLLNKDPIDQT